MANAQITVTVEDIAAGSEDRIRNVLERINGVEIVIINTENRKVFIEFDDEKISEKLIKETIEDEGLRVKG